MEVSIAAVATKMFCGTVVVLKIEIRRNKGLILLPSKVRFGIDCCHEDGSYFVIQNNSSHKYHECQY